MKTHENTARGTARRAGAQGSAWSLWATFCLGLTVALGVPDGQAQTPKQTPRITEDVDKLLEELYPGKVSVIKALERPATSTQTLDVPSTDSQALSGRFIIRGRKGKTPGSDGPLVLPEEASTTEALRLIRAYSQSTTASLGLMDYLEAIKSHQEHQESVRRTSEVEVDGPPAPQDQTPMILRNPDALRINSAPAHEIMEKLGVDARRARLIVQFRELYGPFKTPEDLGQVNGLTDDMIQRWETEDILWFE